MLFSPSELVGFSSLIWDQRHKSRSDGWSRYSACCHTLNVHIQTHYILGVQVYSAWGKKSCFFQPGCEAFMEPRRCPQLQGCWRRRVIVRMAVTFQRRRVVKLSPRVGTGGCSAEPLEAFPVSVCAGCVPGRPASEDAVSGRRSRKLVKPKQRHCATPRIGAPVSSATSCSLGWLLCFSGLLYANHI